MNVLLIGNYVPDAQESMRRYAELLLAGLTQAGHSVTLVLPRSLLNSAARAPVGIWKWCGYLDKYILSPPELRLAARRADVVHICDHSNAVYVPAASARPYVVTCHDLLAVRGALGEDTDCPASFAGRRLQLSILSGLRRAQGLACVSGETLNDATRLLAGYSGNLILAPNALNYPYRPLDQLEARARLAAVPGIGDTDAYVLLVGSNLRRKNRQVAIRALATVQSQWNGKFVFAGQPLTGELWALARELGVAHRILEVVKPSNELLEGLYSAALAFLFPSRFEGFGWPIIEAQACGCAVICSDRPPLPEVAGNAAIMMDSEDHEGFARALLHLAGEPGFREDLRRRGLDNARRFEPHQMIAQFEHLYRQVLSGPHKSH